MAVRAFLIVEDHDHKSADEKSGSADSHAHEGEHQAESHGAEHAEAHGEHAEVAGDHGHEDDFASVAGRKAFYLSSDHLMNHVQDQPYFEIPNGTQYPTPIPIPNPLGYTYEKPMVHAPKGLERLSGRLVFSRLSLWCWS